MEVGPPQVQVRQVCYANALKCWLTIVPVDEHGRFHSLFIKFLQQIMGVIRQATANREQVNLALVAPSHAN